MCTLNIFLNVFIVEMSSIVWPTVFTIFGVLDPTFLKVSLLSTVSLPQLRTLGRGISSGFDIFFFSRALLFQQRPYPSPGAVLRRNAELAGQQGKPTGLNYAPIQKRGDGSDGLGDAD